jgi:hypothetical protein
VKRIPLEPIGRPDPVGLGFHIFSCRMGVFFFYLEQPELQAFVSSICFYPKKASLITCRLMIMEPKKECSVCKKHRVADDFEVNKQKTCFCHPKKRSLDFAE